MTTLLIATHCAAVVLALGVVARAGYRRGCGDGGATASREALVAYARGIQFGCDQMADEYLQAAARSPDPIEAAWPEPEHTWKRPS